ncbi:MAG: tetratricopeptide repeat protein [Sulfuricella sp.]
MSLLMKALKKAERAKQEQTVPHAEQSGQSDGAAETPNSVAAPSPGLSLLPQEGAAGHVDTTGNSDFPSITATQETPSSIPDLAPMATPGIEPEARPQPATSSKPSTRIPPAHHAEARHEAPPQDVRKIGAAQQQARTVFSAKQPARSRTLLLTGSAAAVVLGLVGFGIYYWQITSTRSMALPASTPRPANAAAPAIPVDAGAPQQQGAPAASAQNPIDKPVLSLSKRPVLSLAEEGPAPVTVPASPPAASTASDPARAEARSGAEPFKENPAIRIRQSAATSQLNPALGKAYQSFRSGDTETAQQLYHKVLQQEPNNRDALLGMAAIALKHKQAGQAAAYYGKLLELDPADPDALAGLIGLQGQSDPIQSESRLKKALAQNPQADAAHFALGNLYAQQSRWAEAQQSYFRAYSSAPGNADYAFNLAVSLDHLNQGKLALDYYRRALAQPGPANFDKSSVQTRIQELLKPAGN